MFKLARRYPVTAFFVLAYAITWSVWVPRALVSEGYLDSELILTLGGFWTYGPAVAAVLTAALWGGRAGLRELGSRLIRWRVGVRWYALVLVGPAVFWALVLGVMAALGWSTELGEPVMIEAGFAVVPIFLVLALTDGLGEETGWRGFALPRQLQRFGALRASLLLGVVWAAWHLPLYWTDGASLDGARFWLLLLELPAMSVLFTWIFVNTRGSALLAILFHAAWNACTVGASVAGNTLRVALVIVALKWVLAAAIAAWWARSPVTEAQPTDPHSTAFST